MFEYADFGLDFRGPRAASADEPLFWWQGNEWIRGIISTVLWGSARNMTDEDNLENASVEDSTRDEMQVQSTFDYGADSSMSTGKFQEQMLCKLSFQIVGMVMASLEVR